LADTEPVATTGPAWACPRSELSVEAGAPPEGEHPVTGGETLDRVSYLAHHVAALEAWHQRWLTGAMIKAGAGEEVCPVDADSLDLD
jgi:hypothetical protein